MIKGQEPAVEFLRRSIAADQVAHAYVFIGPAGVGKALTARVFARTLVCDRGGVEPCGACPGCRAVEADSHPDVFFYAPAGRSRSITINRIRDLQRAVCLKAYRGGKKIFIVEDAETLNLEAANCFLKTLEEPPEGTVLVLVTARPDLLPPTVVSRCLAVRFYPWDFGLMTSFLSARAGLDEASARLIHRLSGGSPGRALALTQGWARDTCRLVLESFSSTVSFSAREILDRVKEWQLNLDDRIKALFRDCQREREKMPAAIDPVFLQELEEADQVRLDAERRAGVTLIFEYILSLYRDIYLYRMTGREEVIINQDQAEAIKLRSREGPRRSLKEMIDYIQSCGRELLNRNVSFPLILANLFIRAAAVRGTERDEK